MQHVDNNCVNGRQVRIDNSKGGGINGVNNTVREASALTARVNQ
jgi:hypothetical protein